MKGDTIGNVLSTWEEKGVITASSTRPDQANQSKYKYTIRLGTRTTAEEMGCIQQDE